MHIFENLTANTEGLIEIVWLEMTLYISILLISNPITSVCLFQILLPLLQRGAVVEWLEQLGYGAESRRIAWVRGSAAPCGDWKTLSVNPAENGYLFRIREG